MIVKTQTLSIDDKRIIQDLSKLNVPKNLELFIFKTQRSHKESTRITQEFEPITFQRCLKNNRSIFMK